MLHVMTLDYTWERREVLIRQEERAEGRLEGRLENNIILICKKLRKGQNVAQIADALEEDIDKIQQIVDVANAFAPAFDEEKVMEAWRNMQSMK